MMSKMRCVCLLTMCFVMTLFTTGCSGCENEDDEALIRQLVAKAVLHAEKHDISELMDLATKDFSANSGNYDRRSTKALLMVLFRRYRSFSILHPVVGIDIAQSKTEAELSLPFLLVRKQQTVPDMKRFAQDPAQWMEEAKKIADPFYLKAHLIKEDGEWKVSTANLSGRRSVGL